MVNQCARSGCSEIMCDRLVLNNSRYLCYHCANELETLMEHWAMPVSKSIVTEKILDFISSDRRTSDQIESSEDLTTFVFGERN